MNPLGSRWVDFPVYWEAGQKAIEGRSVYDIAGHFQYKYSPLIALIFGGLFKPLGSFETASWVFQKSMLMIWAFLFWRLAGRRFGILLLLILFFFNALKLDLALGQINAVVLLAIYGLFQSLDHPRNSDLFGDVLFGVIFSLAVQLKLFSLVLVPVLLLLGEWRKLGIGLLLLPVFSMGGVAIFSGWDFAIGENQAWLRTLMASTDELLLDEQNVGLLGSFGKILGLFLAKGVWGLGGFAFVFLLYRWRDRSVAWIRNRAIAAIAVLNPLVWSYWILFLVPLAGEIFSSDRFWKKHDPRRGGGGVLRAFALLFVLAAFLSQHARWAWNGGIFCAIAYLVWTAAENESKEAN